MSDEVGFYDDAVNLVKSSDIDKNELINFPKDMKINIIVGYGMIYMLGAPSKVHRQQRIYLMVVSNNH